MKAENNLTAKLGVTGSPTVFINGAMYPGTASRTAEAYEATICSAFTNPPDACSKISSSPTFNPPKTDKPTVQMFVMSFCPYGKQAEQGIGPAMSVLGKYVTFEPHFIVNVNGDTVNSLHGPNEAAEDKRQAVIWKYWPDEFWSYVDIVNGGTAQNNSGTAGGCTS